MKKQWLLVKNREGEIDKLIGTPVEGKTVADLTTKYSYSLWLRAEKVWVNYPLTRMRFKNEGEEPFVVVRRPLRRTLPRRGP